MAEPIIAYSISTPPNVYDCLSFNMGHRTFQSNYYVEVGYGSLLQDWIGIVITRVLISRMRDHAGIEATQIVVAKAASMHEGKYRDTI